MASNALEAKPLPDVLPTELQVFQHCLYLEQVKVESGEWTKNTPLSTKAKYVAMDISEQWDKSSIPYEELSGKNAVKMEH